MDELQQTQNTWHRVAPVATLYFLIKNIQHAVNFWPALVGMLANPGARQWLFTYGIPTLAIIVLGFAFLHYWFFLYQFDEEKIQIRRGIFNKKKLTLNFDRVQEANLEQAIYFRPFGLWTLRLESAGSTTEAIVLPGTSEHLANTIKRKVLESKQSAHARAQVLSEDQTQASIEGAPNYQMRLDLLDLVRYGLMHNTLIYYGAILGSLLSQNQNAWGYVLRLLEKWALTDNLFDYFTHHGVVADIFAGLIIGAIFMSVFYLLSILMAVVKYWNYTLTVQGERLQYEAGMFNRVACGFRSHKLQTVFIKQGLIARFLRRYSLEVRQTNEIVKKPGDQRGFIVPVMDTAMLEKIATVLHLDITHPASISWQRTCAIQILLNGLLWASLVSLTWGVIVFWWKFSWLWIFPLFILSFLFSLQTWFNTGFIVTGNGFIIKRGLLGRRITYVPLVKVQKLQLQQGPFGRKFNYGSLVIWSGATREVIHYVDMAALYKHRHTILEKVSHHRGRWM